MTGKPTQNQPNKASEQSNSIAAAKTEVSAPSQPLLRALDIMSDTVLLTDADGIVIYANQAMLKQCGFDSDHLIGRSMTTLWTQPNAPTQHIMANLAANRTWRGRIHSKTKNGQLYWEAVTISPITDNTGAVTHFIKTGRIIDEPDERAIASRQIDKTYKSILDLMDDGYVETDLGGNIVFINESAARIYQRSREEMLSLNYKAYMTPHEAEKIYRVFNEIFRTGHCDQIIDYEVIGKDGTPISCETVTHLLRDNYGNPVGFGGIIRNVTEKKRLGAQIRESEESYRRVMELAPDAITISRVSDGKYYEVNEAFCQQTGYAHDEVIGRTVLDLNLYADPEDRKRVVQALRTKGRVTGMRINFRHRDGSMLYDIVSARTIQFKGEDCILVVATLINDLVEAQNALKESEERYRTILSAAPDAICLTRFKDGKYIEANDMFYLRTGYTPEETIGRTAADLSIYANSEDRGRFVAALQAKGQVDGMEILTQYKDGSLSSQLWSGRVIEYNGEKCLLVVAKTIDELKKAQQLLHEREQSYRTILNTSPYSITITRRSDGTYLLVNDAFCRRTGYSREEAIGHTAHELNVYADPTDRDRLIEALRRDGYVFGMEISFRAKSGEILENLVSVSPIMHREEVCILTMTVDIREQKRVQRELERSEESYRVILESSPNSMAVMSSPDFRYITANDSFCKKTGYTLDEIIGKTGGELNLFADQGQRQQVIEELRDKGRIDILEIRFQTKDGTRLESLLSITPIRYMGKPCFLSTNVDVTPLKAAQAALQESEARFRAIFDTAADAIFVTDFETGRFLDVNQAACQHLGYTADTLEKMYLKDVVHDLHPYKIPPSGDDSRSERVFFESMHISSDGTRIPVEVSSGIVMRSGRPALLSIVRDVSERKQAEAELTKYRQHLEEMVQERTSALKEAQNELIKREKLSVLGQLTATVSHELRNPLGVIRTSNFFLSRKIKEKDEKIDKHLRRIEDQVSVCDTIVADLLEFTRGRQVSVEKQSVQPWLGQVVDQLKESEGFDIKMDIAEDLPLVPHDQEKMRRVVINLLDNAIQAVRARREAAQSANESYEPMVALKLVGNDNGLILQVTDNGCGMNESTRRRAFEPLFTTRARGTGIGLANVRKIISEHGGRVELESEQNKGTTMTILLPHEQVHPIESQK